MKEATHVRKDHLIFLASGDLFKDCKTINEAKRTSRLLQKQGSVVRVEKVARPKARVFASHAERRRYNQATPPKAKSPKLLGQITAKQLVEIAEKLGAGISTDD